MTAASPLRWTPVAPATRAQNNTLAVFTDRDTLSRFTPELVAEHLVVVAQGGSLSGAMPSPAKDAAQASAAAAA